MKSRSETCCVLLVHVCFKLFFCKTLDVPIEDDDYVVVPPLEGFVMNRVQGDFFETLLYKIFVSIDENTTVLEVIVKSPSTTISL